MIRFLLLWGIIILLWIMEATFGCSSCNHERFVQLLSICEEVQQFADLVRRNKMGNGLVAFLLGKYERVPIGELLPKVKRNIGSDRNGSFPLTNLHHQLAIGFCLAN